MLLHELGLSQLFRHGFVNPYLVTRENKGRQGIDVTRVEHSFRRELWNLVRVWTNELARKRIAAQMKVNRNLPGHSRQYVTSAIANSTINRGL